MLNGKTKKKERKKKNEFLNWTNLRSSSVGEEIVAVGEWRLWIGNRRRAIDFDVVRLTTENQRDAIDARLASRLQAIGVRVAPHKVANLDQRQQTEIDRQISRAKCSSSNTVFVFV